MWTYWIYKNSKYKNIRRKIICKIKIRDKSKSPIVQGLVTTGTIAEAITTTMVRTILRATATTTILTIATTTSGFVPHSNINSRLYILRNIYSEVLDIKEIYSFLI